MSMSNNFKHNLHNSHSQTELLEMFWWASRWWIEGWASCRLSLREMLRGVRGVGWGLHFGLSHRNTKLNCWKFTKTLKSLQRYCHAIYMLTQLRRHSQFFLGGGDFSCPCSGLAVYGFSFCWLKIGLFFIYLTLLHHLCLGSFSRNLPLKSQLGLCPTTSYFDVYITFH